MSLPISIEAAHKRLDEWYSSGSIGSLSFFRVPDSRGSPHGELTVCHESVVKLFEMSDHVGDLIEKVFELFDAERIEFCRSRRGKPDRVKVSRFA